MISAANGDLAQVKAYISQGADIHAQDDELTTALHYAVYNFEAEVVELLLHEGANPNDSDDYSTALTAALANESYDIAALLYNAGADPTLEDAAGYSALDYLNVTTTEEFEKVLNHM